MSNVLEQFNAAQAAVKNAQAALESLRALLGQAPPQNNGAIVAVVSRRRAAWNYDPVKKARAVARYKRTIKAKRLAREAAQAKVATEFHAAP